MNFGIYIHIPFCQTRCNYCHFVTRRWHPATAERYFSAVVRELRTFFSQNPSSDLTDTIYFGGGTPSMVPVEHIAGILKACRNLFSISHACEITLEANPGSISAASAEAYRSMGVNRVSLGAQSFDNEELASIGRDHSAAQVDESLALLRAAGIGNLNLDLMLGLPGQTRDRWVANLERIAHLAPTHVSVYMLDLDERSPLYHDIARGRHQTPDEDLLADLYILTVARLGAQAYRQYEISNFALPGCASRHNLKYWKREPVLAFGVGSHSFDGHFRYANHAKLSAYLQSVEEGKSPVEWRNPVRERQDLEEKLFLGLRLNEGIDWGRIRREHTSTDLASYEASLVSMSGRGLVEWQDSVVRLTQLGMLLSNEVFMEFV